MLGTVHVAFGASAGIGGTVSVPVHLDCLIEDATLDVGGTRVLDAGRFVRMTRLVAVPNVSEGRDEAVLDAIGAAFATHADVLHRSADADHHRAVFFLAGAPGRAAPGARRRRRRGGGADRPAPPRRAAPARGRARRRPGRVPRGARSAARRSPRRCSRPTRSARRASPSSSTASWPTGARAPSCARAARRGSPRAARGRTTARRRCTRPRARRSSPRAAPLIAFNLELAPPATLDDARRIAALIRAGGEEGLPGVRALGLHLERRDVVQVSTNIEDHRRRHRGRRAGRRGAPPRGPRPPSSWRRRPRPRSPAGPRTSICACRRRSRPSSER